MRSFRFILFLLALVPLAGRPLAAQQEGTCIVCRPLVAVDAGVIHTSTFTDAVAELYVSAETLIPRIRPYAIFSWTPLADQDAAFPTVVTQVAYPLVARGPFWMSLDAGATWYFSREEVSHDVERVSYEPEFTVSSFAGLGLPLPRTYLFGLLSAQPANDWGWTIISGIGYTLHSGS